MSIASAMERAGINVAASRLRALAHEALTKHHRNVERAIKPFDAAIARDPALLRELKLAYLQRLAAEMPSLDHAKFAPQTNDVEVRRPKPAGAGGATRPGRATPGHSTRGLSVITSIQSTTRQGLLYQTKTSDGISWANVCWHELEGKDRDGVMARIIKRRVGVPPNQFMPLHELMTDDTFRECLDEARKQNA